MSKIHIVYDDTTITVDPPMFEIKPGKKVKFKLFPLTTSAKSKMVAVFGNSSDGNWILGHGIESIPGQEEFDTLDAPSVISVTYYKYTIMISGLDALDPHVKVVP